LFPFSARPQLPLQASQSLWQNSFKERGDLLNENQSMNPSAFQSEMADLPINRLRTLSNLRQDDPYFFGNMPMNVAEELLEENENKYA
jgi:hypothetical protein